MRRSGTAILKGALFCAAALGAEAISAQAPLSPVGPTSAVYQPDIPPELHGLQTGADTVAKPITTLEEAIGLAYWTNPTLLAQRSTLRAADTYYPEARSAYGPQITLQGRHDYARDQIETAPGLRQHHQGFSSTAELIFSQTLLSFGRRAAAQGAALAQIALQRNQLRLTEAQTMLDVITAYVLVIRERAVLDIANENLDLLEKQYDNTRKRFSVHEVTSTDVQQVQTRLEFGRAQLLSAKGQLGASHARFLQYVGALPGTLVAPSLPQLPSGTLVDAFAQVELNSPLIQAAQAREKMSRAGIAAARAEQAPVLSLEGTGAYSGTNPYQNSLRTSQLRSALVLNVPLVDSGARRARIERAREDNDADWRLVDMAIREARQTAASAWDGYQAARLSLAHYEAAVTAAEQAYRGAVIQEKAGARTTLDVLDLARDLLNVRNSFVAAQASEYIARATLVAAMGGLEGPMLVPAIGHYNPDAHFRQQDGRGDIPVLTYVFVGLDDIGVDSLSSDRPMRDPAGDVRVSAQLP